MDASQAIKTKSGADPETSLNNINKNNNNAPKRLFPSLADTTDMRPKKGTSTPRIKMNLKFKQSLNEMFVSYSLNVSHLVIG